MSCTCTYMYNYMVRIMCTTGFHLEISSMGAKREFERLWGVDIQGYRSVHIGKQIPRGG